MKKSELKQIIKEEVDKILNENISKIKNQYVKKDEELSDEDGDFYYINVFI